MSALHPDHLYKMPRMNRAFALSSIALLLVLVWMVAADYVRDWKSYQAQFNRLEVEKTQQAIAEAEAAVDAAKLQEITAALEAAAGEIAARRADLEAAEAELAREEAVLYRVDQRFRFAKADLDAFKYEVEEAVAHPGPRTEKLKARLAEQEAELEERHEALLEQHEKMDAIRARIREITAARDGAQAEYDDLFKQKARAERKLEKISPDWRRLVLNLPMLDFVAPTLKVRQVVIPDLKNDVNFLEIPRVDRCITCHTGIGVAGYEEAEQPFRTHPRLELFVGDQSPHPVGEFGCTTCHYGHDRGTSFYSAAHWPSGEEQEHEWEEKYHWHPLHHWDEPMLPKEHIESACRKCHMYEVRIPEGERINRGLLLVERFGCHGCHKITGFEGLPKAGPDLRGLAGKLTPEWTLKWLKDPKSFRPSTRMPKFWDLTNVSTPEMLARNNVEADAINAVLFERSAKRAFPPPPVPGDAARGERLVNEVGCLGCHQVGPDDPVTDRAALRQFGPELNQMGSKVTPGWLFAWIKNPTALSPTTRMPDLRLTDQEAADIVAYLMRLRNPEFEAVPAPAVDGSLRDSLLMEVFGQKMTARQATEKIAAMSEQEKRLFLGERFINRYGCFGCHLIEGWETAPGIGTELSQWASKYVDQLDFGLLQQHATEHEKTLEIAGYGEVEKVRATRQDWAYKKLMDTRIFDVGRVKKADELLKMPWFDFSDGEARSIVTALMSFTKERVALTKLRTLSTEEAIVEEGRRITVNRNCQGCHQFHGWGGEVKAAVQRALVAYDGRSPDEAEAVAGTFAPPPLDGQGAKVNTDWFFRFLKNPATIRPWLKIRMPSFNLSDEDANKVIAHFARHDDAEFPFQTYTPVAAGPAERRAAEQLMSRDVFFCWACHQQGPIKPAGPVDSWAPDLALSRERLRPDWIVRWINDPQKLQPGTKMPTFYDPQEREASAPPDILGGDPDRQIEAMRDYIYSLGAGRTARTN